VRDLVSDLDVEMKQVLLEAIVAEVTLDKEHKFGIDYLFKDLKNQVESTFPVLPPTGPLGVDPLTAGFRYTIIHGGFQAVVTAVQTDQRIHILSTPSIFTSNNQQAEIDVTQSVPYLKGTTVGFGGETSSSVDFLDVGLILNVTPRITADGMVAVDVYQEDSNLVEFRNVGNNAVAPLTSQRVTDTSVTLRDGDTLVLGGLQQHSTIIDKNKIPVLGDLPLIGNLFRSTSRSRQHTELVVFLTPRVINNANEAKRLSDRELNRLKKTVPDAGPVRTQPVAPDMPDTPDGEKTPDKEK
jgi:general secretion pathway protein D